MLTSLLTRHKGTRAKTQNSFYALLDAKDISTCTCHTTNCELLAWGQGPLLSAFIPYNIQSSRALHAYVS